MDICAILVNKQRGVLHDMNVWRLKTLDFAFESAIDVKKWDEALEYGIELLPGFRYDFLNTRFFELRLNLFVSLFLSFQEIQR